MRNSRFRNALLGPSVVHMTHPTQQGAAARAGPNRGSSFGSQLGLSWLLLLATAAPVCAAVTFPAFPDWQSNPRAHVATGCVLRDLNGDNLPDLIVANGNDMQRQPLVVYLNQGGTFPPDPTWTSSDIDYHGHLDLADVDGDGALDCAVAVYLGASGFSAPGYVKLYRGNGNGTFSAAPIWSSQDRFYSFSCSFGDVDMDGRPDLACAAGESYNRVKERFRVYRNVGGSLEPLPYWQSAETRYALDVTWGDVNGDGILDAAFACESNPTPGDPITYPTEVYFGNGTTLAAAPSWRSQDGHDYSNTLCLGDLNGDGWPDLAVADNNQLHGGTDYGRTKVFLNDGLGHLGTLPAWTSNWGGYGSNVSFADVDHDGDLDLAAGSWWGPVRIYENTGGSLPANPTWQSATGSVIENIVWEDVDNDGLEAPMDETFTGTGLRKHFVLRRRPVRLLEVALNGVPLSSTEFFASEEQGWLTLGEAPSEGAILGVRYAASADLDFAVSNWDSDVGNYLFKNTRNPAGVGIPAQELAFSVAPNPAPGECRVLYEPIQGTAVSLEIVDATGRCVRSIPGGAARLSPGLIWDGRDALGKQVASGTYWIRLTQGRRTETRRLVLLR